MIIKWCKKSLPVCKSNTYFNKSVWTWMGSPAGVFQTNGTAISPVINIGGDIVNWNDLLNTTTLPTNTSVAVEIRTTDNGVTWSGYGAVGDAANSIFAQIRLTLSSDPALQATPAVDIVKLRAFMLSAVRPVNFQGVKTIKIIASDSPFTAPLVPEQEVIIEGDTDGGAITINLDAALDIAGKVYSIKNTGTSDNDITIDPSGSETIDGDTTRIVVDEESIKIQSNGLTLVKI